MAEQKEKSKQLFCPYCDEEIVETATDCHACQITIFYCPECRKPLPRENRVCPHCGAAIKGASSP